MMYKIILKISNAHELLTSEENEQRANKYINLTLEPLILFVIGYSELLAIYFTDFNTDFSTAMIQILGTTILACSCFYIFAISCMGLHSISYYSPKEFLIKKYLMFLFPVIRHPFFNKHIKQLLIKSIIKTRKDHNTKYYFSHRTPIFFKNKFKEKYPSIFKYLYQEQLIMEEKIDRSIKENREYLSKKPYQQFEAWAIEQYDIKSFCKTIFNRQSPSIIRDLSQKWSSRNITNTNFIFWCLLIPKKEFLKDDDLKTMLGFNRFNTPSDQISLEDLLSGRLLAPFNQYQDSRLKQIFSQHYHPAEYIQVLKTIKNLQENKVPFYMHPKPKDVKDILDYLLAQSSSKDIYLNQLNYYPNAKNIDHLQLEDGYKIKVMEDKNELLLWGEKLSHCIGNEVYTKEASKGNCLLLGIYKNNKPFANIEIEDGEITQAKAKGNRELNKKEASIIFQALQDHYIISNY